ncbi:Rho-binding antiterminator [Pontibacter sp. JAM-7]|uniref:Rho-binding antiterminator n=1 Tax=Pontibacter sp. JAM-7 TaxID=3366581 RepID=UPI003AF41837
MTEQKPYQPINCDQHDGYELACMRHAIHLFKWHDGNQIRSEKLRCRDLEYTGGAEYLLADNRDGEPFRIRLDQIISSLPY